MRKKNVKGIAYSLKNTKRKILPIYVASVKDFPIDKIKQQFRIFWANATSNSIDSIPVICSHDESILDAAREVGYRVGLDDWDSGSPEICWSFGYVQRFISTALSKGKTVVVFPHTVFPWMDRDDLKKDEPAPTVE